MPTFNEKVMHELGSITAEIKNLKESTDGLKAEIQYENETRSKEIEKSFDEIRKQNEVLTHRVTALESLKHQLVGAAMAVGTIVSIIIGIGKYVLEHLWPK